MPILSSQVLNTSSPFYSAIVEAFVLGQNTGSNNLTNLKTGATCSSSLIGGANLSSDADGDYTYVTTTVTSERSINTTVDRSNTAYTFIVTAKLDVTIPSNNYAGVFHLANASNQGLAAYFIFGGSMNWQHTNLASVATGGVTTSLATYVIVWDGSLLKRFRTSVASTSISYTSAPLTGTGTVTRLRIGNYGASFPGKYYFIARMNSALSDADAQSIANDVSQLLSSGITYTYSRPASDITTQWSTSSGTTHYTLIDETVADDTDYIVATAAGQTDEVKLQSMTPPQVGTNLVINYKVTGVDGGATVTVSLRQGSAGTLIKTDTAKSANGTYALTVTPADWAAVTDWSDLRLRFVSA